MYLVETKCLHPVRGHHKDMVEAFRTILSFHMNLALHIALLYFPLERS